ncbi:MAG: arginyltransferase [Plesiomonas sp.]|uniref:arginyltransferase n=1 Tax=Plesiomonas sp. TaxID=2486279 RepID=UPI003F3B0A34
MSSDYQSTQQKQIQLWLTPPSTCSYLPEQSEQIGVVSGTEWHTTEGYSQLLAHGFRRNGDAIYKPHCPVCHACKQLRISVVEFQPSRSQKRALQHWHAVSWQICDKLPPEFFTLYAKYINARHASGSMYPPNKAQFESFTQCHWLSVAYLCMYQGSQLIAVAVTDVLPDSLSACYTFFDPGFSQHSPGVAMLVKQLEWARQIGKRWVYPGYQVDACKAMSYKKRFRPAQELTPTGWQWIDKC